MVRSRHADFDMLLWPLNSLPESTSPRRGLTCASAPSLLRSFAPNTSLSQKRTHNPCPLFYPLNPLHRCICAQVSPQCLRSLLSAFFVPFLPPPSSIYHQSADSSPILPVQFLAIPSTFTYTDHIRAAPQARSHHRGQLVNAAHVSNSSRATPLPPHSSVAEMPITHHYSYSICKNSVFPQASRRKGGAYVVLLSARTLGPVAAWQLGPASRCVTVVPMAEGRTKGGRRMGAGRMGAGRMARRMGQERKIKNGEERAEEEEEEEEGQAGRERLR